MATKAVARGRVVRFLPLRIVAVRPRLFGCVLLALVVGFVAPADWRVITRFLVAWNTGAWTYLVLALTLMLRADGESMARRAAAQDEGRFAMLTVSCLASVASIGAILAELAVVKDLSGAPKFLHIWLAACTIVSAWLFIHLVFALHYAHEFFGAAAERDGSPAARRGGLKFPSTEAPDFSDFLYFAYIIGVASQTADVAITSRAMRRVSLAHSVLSFFFNTIVLALTINIAAGLI